MRLQSPFAPLHSLCFFYCSYSGPLHSLCFFYCSCSGHLHFLCFFHCSYSGHLHSLCFFYCSCSGPLHSLCFFYCSYPETLHFNFFFSFFIRILILQSLSVFYFPVILKIVFLLDRHNPLSHHTMNGKYGELDLWSGKSLKHLVRCHFRNDD